MTQAVSAAKTNRGPARWPGKHEYRVTEADLGRFTAR
jgi:hypothetical protein